MLHAPLPFCAGLQLLVLAMPFAAGRHMGCDRPLHLFVGTTADESALLSASCPVLCGACPPDPEGLCRDDPNGSLEVLAESCYSQLEPLSPVPGWLPAPIGQVPCSMSATSWGFPEGTHAKDICPVSCACTDCGCNPLPEGYTPCRDDPGGVLASFSTDCAKELGLGTGLPPSDSKIPTWIWYTVIDGVQESFLSRTALAPAVAPPLHLDQHNWMVDVCAGDESALAADKCGCRDPYAPNYSHGAMYEDGSCSYAALCSYVDDDTAAVSAAADLGATINDCHGLVAIAPCDHADYGAIVTNLCPVTCNVPIGAKTSAAGWDCTPTVVACESAGPCLTAQYIPGVQQNIRGTKQFYRHMKFLELERTAAQAPWWENTGSQFSNPTAGSGGAISVSGEGIGTDFAKGYASISFSIFWHNVANAYGGAIYGQNGARIAVSFSSFAFNAAARESGGAIFITIDSELHVHQSTFIDNAAWKGGGAICGTSGPALLMSASTFILNKADISSHINLASAIFAKISTTTIYPFKDFSLHGAGNVIGGASVQISGIPSDCYQHPCLAGQSCEIHQYSLSCKACPQYTAGLNGVSCITCPSGEGPSGDRTKCVACAGNTYSDAGLCRDCRAGFISNSGKTACIDLDECATDNGGCDVMMGTEQGLLPCQNTDGSRQCNRCPSSLEHDTADDTCNPRILEPGAASTHPVATLNLELAEDVFEDLQTEGSVARTSLISNIASSLGIPAAAFEVQLVHKARRRRALLEIDAVLQIVFVTTDPAIQRMAISQLNTQLRSSSSQLMVSVPSVVILAASQVRKTPSWPRSWANFSLL
jgi:hypothetical protein